MIKYTPGKENGRADALSRREDMVEPIKDNRAILKVNDDGTISNKPQEFNSVVRVLTDMEEQYPISKQRLRVPEDQIQECIRSFHDNQEKGHPGRAGTCQLIKRYCVFPKIQ